jgi:hypothetical protein
MTLPQIDLSKATKEELLHIQSEVVRQVALSMGKGGVLAEGHDSHSSSHSKNNVAERKA